jgi:hypothetical protein
MIHLILCDRYSGSFIPESQEAFQRRSRLSFHSNSFHMGPWNIRTIDSPRKKALLKSWSEELNQTYGQTATAQAAQEFLATHGVTAQDVSDDDWHEWQDAVQELILSQPSSSQASPQPAAYSSSRSMQFGEEISHSGSSSSSSSSVSKLTDITAASPVKSPSAQRLSHLSARKPSISTVHEQPEHRSESSPSSYTAPAISRTNLEASVKKSSPTPPPAPAPAPLSISKPSTEEVKRPKPPSIFWCCFGAGRPPSTSTDKGIEVRSSLHS